jgi:hypothetical protein
MSDAATLYGAGSLEARGVDAGDGILPLCPMFDGDVDAVLGYLADLAGEGRRRTAPLHGRSSPRASADDRKTPAAPRIDLILYMSAESEKSRRALRAVREVLKDYDPDQVRFSTCDLSVTPQDAEADSVVFTPTLVTQGSGPRTSIIGNLEDRDILRDLLDASGVDRRWDD